MSTIPKPECFGHFWGDSLTFHHHHFPRSTVSLIISFKSTGPTSTEMNTTTTCWSWPPEDLSSVVARKVRRDRVGPNDVVVKLDHNTQNRDVSQNMFKLAPREFMQWHGNMWKEHDSKMCKNESPPDSYTPWNYYIPSPFALLSRWFS